MAEDPVEQGADEPSPDEVGPAQQAAAEPGAPADAPDAPANGDRAEQAASPAGGRSAGRPPAGGTGRSRAGTKAGTGDAAEGPRPNRRKVREGLVVSDRMTGTVVVAVNERVPHSRYGKIVQRTKKLYVDDAENSAKVGDRVRVVETRPLSRLKRWRLAEIVERAR